jgi:hypothetical protein
MKQSYTHWYFLLHFDLNVYRKDLRDLRRLRCFKFIISTYMETIQLCAGLGQQANISQGARKHCAYFHTGYDASADGYTISRICVHEGDCGIAGCLQITYDVSPLTRADLNALAAILSSETHEYDHVSRLLCVSNVEQVCRFLDYFMYDADQLAIIMIYTMNYVLDRMTEILHAGEGNLAVVVSQYYCLQALLYNAASDMSRHICNVFPIPSDALLLPQVSQSVTLDPDFQRKIDARQRLADALLNSEAPSSIGNKIHAATSVSSVIYHYHEVKCDTSVIPLPSEVTQLLTQDRIVVAGGAAMRMHPLATSKLPLQLAQADIDIYVLAHDEQLATVGTVAKALICAGYTMSRLGSSVLVFRQANRLPIQVIMAVYENTRALLDMFDFTAVRCAFDGERYLCSFQTWSDFYHGRMGGSTWSPISYERFAKMTEKGFLPAPGVLLPHPRSDPSHVVEVPTTLWDFDGTVECTRLVPLRTNDYLSDSITVHPWTQLAQGASAAIPTRGLNDRNVIQGAKYLVCSRAYRMPLCRALLFSVQMIHHCDVESFLGQMHDFAKEFVQINTCRPRRYPGNINMTMIDAVLYINGVRSDGQDVPKNAILSIVAAPYLVKTHPHHVCFQALEVYAHTAQALPVRLKSRCRVLCI